MDDPSLVSVRDIMTPVIFQLPEDATNLTVTVEGTISDDGETTVSERDLDGVVAFVDQFLAVESDRDFTLSLIKQRVTLSIGTTMLGDVHHSCQWTNIQGAVVQTDKPGNATHDQSSSQMEW